MNTTGVHIQPVGSAGASGPNNTLKVATKCCVCLEEDDYRGTALIRCGRCAIDVHVKCYGKSIPTDGSAWLCEPCSYMETAPSSAGEPPRVQPSCVICPCEGGALRLTSQANVWSHVLCMNWIPELSHSLTGEMDEVLNIQLLDRSREALKCLICGQRGGCIQCISGRCARAFHVVCAMRAPSDVIFTGYNNDSQQVYHCKTHSSDIATFKYEMVDHSWKSSPLLLTFLEKHPANKDKCRVCHTKVPSINFERHETLCLISWLAKEEAKSRRQRLQAAGVSAVAVDYGHGAAGGKKNAITRAEEESATPNTPAKASKNNRKHAYPMRPCPQCGQQVRETKMMGHMMKKCGKGRAKNGGASSHPGKNPASRKRQQQSGQRQATTSSGMIDLTQEDEAAASMVQTAQAPDLSDVLFATWPGQAAGSLLDSTNLWKIVHNNFFSTKILLKKRMEPLCKNLCGARLEDMGNFSQKITTHDAMQCADTVLFDRPADAPETLALNSILHRCDFMMRGSRMRCLDDLFVKPLIQVDHTTCSRQTAAQEPFPPPPAADATTTAAKQVDQSEVVVQFKNTDRESVSCRLAFRLEPPTETMGSSTNGQATQVWVKYHPDAVSTIVGAGLENFKPVFPSGQNQNLWISLQDVRSIPSSLQTTDEAVPQERDELTPEASVLIEQLREQMQQNRHRVRRLCRRTQLQDAHEEAAQKEKHAVESYYKEFALWKALSTSLLIGYRAFWRAAPAAVDPSTDGTNVGEKQEKASGGGQGEDAVEEDQDLIDDGTCVVCFDGQSPESNPIIFCDRCDLAVHQRCYGIQHVPNGEFYCDRCRLEDDGRDSAVEVYCQLCPLRDGAFKKTIDGKWVHVVCSLWCPGVWIGNLQNLSEIKLVDSAHRTRFVDTTQELKALIYPQQAAVEKDGKNSAAIVASRAHTSLEHGSLCQYCRVACGRTIQCCHPDCSVSYHPLCGWFEGHPMTVSLPQDKSYVYSGGGSGLVFAMHCGRHMPDDYTEELRLSQRKNRRRFRIDSFFTTQSKLQPMASGRGAGSVSVEATATNTLTAEEWTDKELCAACFDYASPVPADLPDVNHLAKRQLMLRCQYCNTFVHASCCLSEIDDVSDCFQSNWICERCTLVDQAKKAAAATCLVCDRASDYMMPCVPLISGGADPLAKNGAAVDTADRWVHVLCARMAKAKVYKRNHVLCATPPVLSNETTGRCDVCQSRGRNLASCGNNNCSKRFHPTCAARKKYYVKKSNKTDWKFYCPSHPPADVAYDEARQSWFTGEILAHLHELRLQLERGRMIVEMARQRDRQKKRLLNLCAIKKMELSMEMILKKRPTAVMKEIFTQFTGDTMEDVPKKEVVKPSRKKGGKSGKSRKRARSQVEEGEEEGNENAEEAEEEEEEEEQVVLVPRRTSSRSTHHSDDTHGKRSGGDVKELDETPRKRRRHADAAAPAAAVDVTPSRRSSRRGADVDGGADTTAAVTPSSERAMRVSSRQRNAPEIFGSETAVATTTPAVAPPPTTRQRNRALELSPPEEKEEVAEPAFDLNSLSDELEKRMRASDFDGVIEEIYPEMTSE